MTSLGLPHGFEVFHDIKDGDDMDDMSLGDMSLVTLGSTVEADLESHTNNNANGACPSKQEDTTRSDGENSEQEQRSGTGSPKDDGQEDVDKPSRKEGKGEEQEPEQEPRMVSADSMATVKHANMNQTVIKPPERPSQTPYDSLKDLVKSRKRQRTDTDLPMLASGSGLIASRSGTAMSTRSSRMVAGDSQSLSMSVSSNSLITKGIGTSINSSGLVARSSTGMVSRPSTFLRQALYGSTRPTPQPNQNFPDMNQVGARMNKKPEVTNPLLHKACIKRGVEADVIEAILKIDKTMATSTHQIYQTKNVYSYVRNAFVSTKVKEKYCYALNLALKNQAKPAAVELLVRAAPHVAALADGTMKECSLSILLKNRPKDSHLADLLLLSNPACAKTRDCHQNTPLHVACQYGASLSTVKHICILYPPALHVKNRFGLTPLQVAQRSNHSNEIATYLLVRQRVVV